MTLIFQSPKLPAETAREKQKAEVCHRIAVMVATQVLELVKVGAPAVTRQNIQSLHGGDDNKLLQTIMQLVRDVTWPIIEPAVAREKTVLAPTVTAMDAQGRATTERETVLEKKGTSVDVLPWPKCVEFKTPYPDNHRSKLLLEAAIRQLHRPFMEDPPPISMVRAGKRIEMRATERLAKGKCVIPVFSESQTPWLWKTINVEHVHAMASIARFLSRGIRKAMLNWSDSGSLYLRCL